MVIFHPVQHSVVEWLAVARPGARAGIRHHAESSRNPLARKATIAVPARQIATSGAIATLLGTRPCPASFTETSKLRAICETSAHANPQWYGIDHLLIAAQGRRSLSPPRQE